MNTQKTYALVIGLSVAALVAAVLALAYHRTAPNPNPVAVNAGVDASSIPEAAERPAPDRYTTTEGNVGVDRRSIPEAVQRPSAGGGLSSTAKPAIFTIASPAIEPRSDEAPNKTGIERMKPLELPATTSSGGNRSFISHPELPPGVAYASDSDPVLIEWVEIAPNPVRLGDIVRGRVITSSNAAAVTAQIGSFLVSVPKVAPGTFSVSARVPRALWWPRQVDVVVTATRTDGKSVAAAVPVNVTR